MFRAANVCRTKPRSRAICCGEMVSANRCKTPAGARPQRKSCCRSRQQAKPRTATSAEQLDASDAAVLVGIKFHRDFTGRAGRRAFRHFDDAAGAANAERRCRCFDLHVAGLGDLMGRKGDGATDDLNSAELFLPPSS